VSQDITRQLDSIFKPESIAVIGASRNLTKWGGRILSQALSSDYRGRIYPVNPKEKNILGVKAYPGVQDIPGSVELAVFTVPAAQMPTVMADCVKKGVKGGVIISADFAETGDEGKRLEEETVRIARSGGLRFVGPNGNGIWTSAVRLNLAPFPTPMNGPIAFVSQSGSFGGMASRAAMAQGFGLSKFISIGNQADLNAADYLEYLAGDDDTKVIALYMEGIKDGRRFFQTAREVTRIKPVLIYKGGSSNLGARATLTHTASIAGTEAVFSAMCHQAGLIRVHEVGHLFIMAEALAYQPLPRGKRVAVVGNGGQGVAIMDFLAALGVDAPEFQPEDKLKLKAILPPHAPVPNNPVDFAGANPGARDEVTVIEALASLDYIDGIITNAPSEMSFSGGSLAEQKKEILTAVDVLANLPKKYGKPVITQLWHLSDTVSEILRFARIPMYYTPEDCARAMFALVKYAEIKSAGNENRG